MVDVAYLQEFAQLLPIPFWATRGKDEGYAIAFWNDAATLVYGYSREEAIGASFLELFVEEFLRERAARDCDNVINGSFSHPKNVITVDRTKDHAPLVVLTNVFRLDYGGCAYQAEMSIDFTGSPLDEMIRPNYRALTREAESSPNVRQLTYLLQERLDREHEQVNRWAAGVMHDVRTEAGSARDHLISYRHRINQSNRDRDIAMLDNLLRSLQFRADAFIGVYGGGLGDAPSGTFEGWTVLISELGRLEEYGPIMFHASIEYPDGLDGREVELRGRPDAFRQCVYNLFQNACRHMRLRGGQRFVRVEVEVDEAGRCLDMVVINPGWIESEHLASDSVGYEHISLGLRLVREVVEEVGGTLSHENVTVGGVATVRARLQWPIASLDSVEAE